MDSLLQDLRYAARSLARTPGFTLAVALTLALAIGANTVFYSAVHAVLLRPLPFPQPERLVRVWDQQEGYSRASVSAPELLNFREHARSLAGLAAYDRQDKSRTDGDAPERVTVSRTTVDLLEVLGVSPAAGRAFTPEDEGQKVALVSHAYWSRRLGARADAVGSSLVLDGESHTVVGVLPRGLTFTGWTDEPEVWLPLRLDPTSHKGMHFLVAIGRLEPGFTVEQALADLQRVNQAFWKDDGRPRPHGALVMGWQRMLTEKTAPMLWTLLGAVGFVLLIACANVANLMLVRALGRQREGAIRAALGASRSRHVQQLLVESVVLALVGGALGVALSVWGMELARWAVPERLQRVAPLTLSPSVLLFTLGLSVGTGLLFGLVPAWQASRPDLMGVLRTSGSAVGARGRHPLRSVLVVVQLALAMMLLVGTGLTLKMLQSLEQADLGFEPQGTLTARLSLPPARYEEEARTRAFWAQLLERLSALPGVEAAGAISHAPLAGTNVNGGFQVEGRPTPEGELYTTEKRVVSPDYFRAMGMELRRGRGFTAQDTESVPSVVVVNETLARRYFPGEDAVGKRILLGFWGDGTAVSEIVGVVEDVRQAAANEPPAPEAYVPVAQVPQATLTLVVRTTGAPSQLAGPLREAVQALDPQQPVYDVRTYQQVVDGRLESERTASRLIGAFALLALGLAALGIYGVMAYTVGQRARELSIRRALGAPEGHVLGLVMGQGARLTLAAVGVGLLGAAGLGRVVASSLYGVSAFEPLIFLAVSVLLGGVALLACWLPARRASRVDPAVVLRGE